MRLRASRLGPIAVLALVAASHAATAAPYRLTAQETSAFGPETVSIALDTADAVAVGGRTLFSDATVAVNGAFRPGGVFTTDTNDIGGPGFFFIDTDVPTTRIFYAGSGADTVFDPGVYAIADGANDGEGVLTITGGPASAAPEPAAWVLLLAGVGGAGLALRHARRDAPRRPFTA